MVPDEVRARYLRDRVMTATPAQRVVMLYDRLGLDLTRAADTEDAFESGMHLGHAMEVLAELRTSLDVTAGGPAENLASIYAFLLRELLAARGGERERIAPAREVVTGLRDAWAQAADLVATASSTPAGAWVS